MAAMKTYRAALLTSIICCTPFAATAEVTRIDIAARADVLNGKAFGLVGPYEKIVGKAWFSIDPAKAANKSIVDLDKAPRDAKGRVVFSADVYILAPKDQSRGNGVALFDVVNRGNKTLLARFNHAAQSLDPMTEADFGDGFLMQHGYTLIAVGWQLDVPKRSGVLGVDAPRIAVSGRVSTLFTPNASVPTYELESDGYYSVRQYPPADVASGDNQLTVREGLLGAPRMIPRGDWQLVSNASAVSLKSGFEAGKTYELSYEAKNGAVAGVGFAALRDLAAYVKHAPTGAVVTARNAYVYGQSQDGRVLRDFLYQGFNADEEGRKAFDAVMAHIAGASRGDFNVRFAEPNSLGAFTATRFPYLNSPQFDPITGKTDGLLSHLSAATMPLIIYTNSSTEYWGGGRSAALTHTTLDGHEDAALPENVRIYLFAGTQHTPALASTQNRLAQQDSNPNDYAWGQRSLLLAMDRWVHEGVAPPASRYPKLADGTLVEQKSLKFPALPGVHSPLSIPGGYRSDLDASHPLPFLVPQVDADGNERGGIRFPEVAVPLATYTGWNFRNAAIGAPGELLPLTGTYVPFAPTRAAREQNHDPRLSIEERYPSRTAYLGQVTDAAMRLIQEGYVLREDLAGIVAQANARWDATTR
jgi:hypothetical protein